MYIGFKVLSKFSSFFVSIIQRGFFNHLRVSCQHIAQSPRNSSVLVSYRDILLYHQVLPFVKRVYMQIRFSYHVSSVSFKLELFLSLSLTFLTDKFWMLQVSYFIECASIWFCLMFFAWLDSCCAFSAGPSQKDCWVLLTFLSGACVWFVMVVSHTLIPWLSFCLLGLSIIALFFPFWS